MAYTAINNGLREDASIGHFYSVIVFSYGKTKNQHALV